MTKALRHYVSIEPRCHDHVEIERRGGVRAKRREQTRAHVADREVAPHPLIPAQKPSLLQYWTITYCL
jgi:hypothetical protein